MQISLNKKLTFKEEKEWVKSQLKEIKENKLHYLVAICNSEIIGGVELRKGVWSQSHVAEVGISIEA